jgi:predicted DNA-binding ribbon-helix-helix protein
LWEALREIALRENRTLHDICSDIDKTRGETGLTSAMRIYIVNYYRSAANPS